MTDPAPVQTSGSALSANPHTIWRYFTVALLFVGYAAYYFCRSDLSVAMPLLIEDLHARGYRVSDATIRLGAISSWGVLAYAIGKLCLAGLGDFWGGRRSFVLGLGGAILFTLVFASSGTLPVFTIAWIGNRLVQSIGWAGLVKVCSKWFSYSSYGAVLGILSLSYLIGDAAARAWMGSLIQHGFGWRSLFYFGAIVAAVILTANLLFLKESGQDVGLPAPQVNPLNLFRAEPGGSASDDLPGSLGALLFTLVRHPAFWIVCALSLGCTLLRETFNIWTPTYLRQALRFSDAKAASTSAIFPGVGAVSVLVSGWVSDRLGVHGRTIVTAVGLGATTVVLLLLAGLHGGTASTIPVLLIGAVALFLLGPYSYLAGAMALDFGGRKAGAASSGIIDGVGYLGGVLAGDTVARVSVAFGWQGVFVMLAGVSLVSACAAIYLLWKQNRG